MVFLSSRIVVGLQARSHVRLPDEALLLRLSGAGRVSAAPPAGLEPAPGTRTTHTTWSPWLAGLRLWHVRRGGPYAWSYAGARSRHAQRGGAIGARGIRRPAAA